MPAVDDWETHVASAVAQSQQLPARVMPVWPEPFTGELVVEPSRWDVLFLLGVGVLPC